MIKLATDQAAAKWVAHLAGGFPHPYAVEGRHER